jgi:hypothetical protein
MSDLNVDAPIPYVLTEKGRRDLAMALADDAIGRCAHKWEWCNGGLKCTRCAHERDIEIEHSIPAYLGNFKRERRK